MIDQFIHLLGYGFVQNAFEAGLVIAIVAGLVSRFVVARNMAFAVHALAELGFTGRPERSSSAPRRSPGCSPERC